MKRIKIFFVSKTGEDRTKENFNRNICTYLKSDSQLEDYVLNRYIWDNIKHYSAWLDLKDLEDTDKTRKLYISADQGKFYKYASQFCGKYCKVNSEGISTMLRIAFCEPVGASYESPEETHMYTNKLFLELTGKSLKENLKELTEAIGESNETK